MDDVADKSEILRLTTPGYRRVLTRARWSLIYRWYCEGRTFEEMSVHFGRSTTTIIRLLKRAAREEQKKPGFLWPMLDGLPVCDIHHPAPAGSNPRAWRHVRGRNMVNIMTGRVRENIVYCPVCQRSVVGATAGGSIPCES